MQVFCSRACGLRGRARGAAIPPDVERAVERLPFHGPTHDGADVSRACPIHRCRLSEDPLTGDLTCRVGRHSTDEWLVTVAGHVVAQVDRFGPLALAPCLYSDAMRDYLGAAEPEAAVPRPPREDAA